MSSVVRILKSGLAMACAGLILAGCAEMKPVTDALKPSKPEVSVAGVRLTDLSPTRADLQFMLDVRNDNAFSLDLAGLDYDFKVAGRSLVSGRQDATGKLEANATSQLPLMVSLDFSDLKDIAAAVAGQDEFSYDLAGELGVKLPVLGVQPVKLGRSGSLPVPRMPKVRLDGLKLGEVGLTGAEVTVNIEVENPNGFALDVRGLNLDLLVNDQPWGAANVSETLKVPSKSSTQVGIPLKLDFARIGQTGFQLLVRRQPFDYRLRGGFELDTDLPLLQDLKIPLDVTGRGMSL